LLPNESLEGKVKMVARILGMYTSSSNQRNSSYNNNEILLYGYRITKLKVQTKPKQKLRKLDSRRCCKEEENGTPDAVLSEL
jgi:hypothetical protein